MEEKKLKFFLDFTEEEIEGIYRSLQASKELLINMRGNPQFEPIVKQKNISDEDLDNMLYSILGLIKKLGKVTKAQK